MVKSALSDWRQQPFSCCFKSCLAGQHGLASQHSPLMSQIADLLAALTGRHPSLRGQPNKLELGVGDPCSCWTVPT
eukprot:1423071-Rhodomonas_salina.1